MKDSKDQKTIDMLPMPKKRGRPVTGKAKSQAQRQAEYMARKKERIAELERIAREMGIEL